MTMANQLSEADEAAPRALPPKIVCRQIKDADVEPAIALLSRGFPERSSEYWRRAMHRLRNRTVPAEFPRYGYVMTVGDVMVGIVLVIVSLTDRQTIRANVSSWFVEPAFRAYSGMLLAPPFRFKDVTFVNISPAPGTIETIVAQGFSRYVNGTFHAIAALGPRVAGAKVRAVLPHTRGASPLLVEHASCGCLCLEVTCANETHPFVFVPFRSLRNKLPSAQLVYCRDVADFVRFSGTLGRYLARLGIPSVMLDANGPVKGLVGRYFRGRRLKYCKGPTAPRLCDLSATELVYLGP